MARSPAASMSRFRISSFHVVVRSRYMCSPIRMVSTTLHGRGWYPSSVNSIGKACRWVCDEVVHAARVGRQRRAIFGRQRYVRHFRDAPYTQPARIAVKFQSSRTHDFREIPTRQTPQPVHLEKPVLRRRIPLREEDVILARRRDVRHSQRVPRNRHALRNWRCNRARCLRQHPVHEPVHRSGGEQQHDPNGDVEVTEYPVWPAYLKLSCGHAGVRMPTILPVRPR